MYMLRPISVYLGCMLSILVMCGLSWTPKMRQVAKVEPCP